MARAGEAIRRKGKAARPSARSGACPFHLAFLVRDLESTRRFYVGLLGCREGRSTDAWVDLEFYGHQLSAHVSAERPQLVACGHVDSVAVPIPHFGAIVGWEEFERLAARLGEAGVRFVLEPQVRYRGKPAEQATLFVLDPSGNAIELKSFRDPRAVFAP